MSCGQKGVSGSGNKIKAFVSILPECVRDEPKDVTVTANGVANANGQTITVTTTALSKGATTITVAADAIVTATTITTNALGRDIPSGTPIIFNAGTPTESSTTTTAAANAGDTSLAVTALTVALTTGDTATVSVDGATTIDVAALPVALTSGLTITFNEGLSTEQTVTLTAAAAASATSITVEPLATNLTAGDTGTVNPATTLNVLALTGAISKGSRLTFNEGTSTESRVYLAADANQGDTLISISDLSVDIAAGSVAEYIAFIRLLGGTSTGRNVNPNRSGITVFEDEGGFEDGVITNGAWDVPWSGNYLIDDEGYERVEEAAFQSPIDGREMYLILEYPAPVGKTIGPVTKGAVTVTGFSDTLPADGILTNSFTFNGQGTPIREKAK